MADVKGAIVKAAKAVGRELTESPKVTDPKLKNYPMRESGVGGAKKAVAQAIESFSHRGSELSKAERTTIKIQNKVADTMKSKDLDAMERGKKAAESRRLGEEQKQEYAHSVGYKEGQKDTLKKVAVPAAGLLAAAEEVGRAIGKKQGSQANHHVTDNNNHTKTVK